MISWDGFQDLCAWSGKKQTFSKPECMRAAEALGLTLPSSYIEYQMRFGLGEWEGGLRIASPVDRDDVFSLAQVVEDWKATMDSPVWSWAGSEFIQFGSHANGYPICWKTNELTADEYAIYILFHDDKEAIRCGSDLLEFLDNHLHLRIPPSSERNGLKFYCM